MAETRDHLAALLRVTPGGAQTRSKRASVLPPEFPDILTYGKGSRVWGPDGVTFYTDWICGLGAISLGYSFDLVDEAVRAQIFDGGPSWSLPHRLELETSELLLETLREHGLPHVEQVRWVKTGSEATVAAMMIARRVTGRDTILSIGYHGWHEAHLDRGSMSLINIPWGEPGILMEQFKEVSDETAGVLLEACRDTEPPAWYLQAIREFCVQNGALLIMDECVTGFRWAIGGASEYFGIEPDLAVFGKGMANGYPLACVVGPADTLSHAVDCSGTFGGEAVSLAAAGATIRTFREHDVIGHMASVGQEWISSGEATGYPCHPRLTGNKEEVMAKAGILAREGVLVHPAGFNVSFSHTREQAQEAIRVLQAARVSPLP